jgi:hypothetical protein
MRQDCIAKSGAWHPGCHRHLDDRHHLPGLYPECREPEDAVVRRDQRLQEPASLGQGSRPQYVFHRDLGQGQGNGHHHAEGQGQAAGELAEHLLDRVGNRLGGMCLLPDELDGEMKKKQTVKSATALSEKILVGVAG